MGSQWYGCAFCVHEQKQNHEDPCRSGGGNSDFEKRAEDPRLAMCDGISLIAQEWAEQNPIGQGTSAWSFMRRICDVLGTTYGGEPLTPSFDRPWIDEREDVERRR